MMIIVFGIGILLALIGIIAFFVPAVTRIIDIPGNERIKAIVAVIVGVIISYIGYVSLFITSTLFQGVRLFLLLLHEPFLHHE